MSSCDGYRWKGIDRENKITYISFLSIQLKSIQTCFKEENIGTSVGNGEEEEREGIKYKKLLPWMDRKVIDEDKKSHTHLSIDTTEIATLALKKRT